MIADHKERLRRLALHDDGLIQSMLALDLGEVEVQWALAAGATADEIVGTLMAVAPITGVARVLAAAPEFAMALDYDLDAAFEGWNEDPG